MSYPINYPTPQGANFQAFYGGGSTRDWVKPQGVSMVRMLLIGAGGSGGGSDTTAGGGGGGSGAVTQWIGPAMFVPNVLQIQIGRGNGASTTVGASLVIYQQKDGTGYTLLRANGGTSSGGPAGGGGGTAFANNYFGAAGIFKSVAGQAGAAAGNNLSTSSTTFLSGGAGGANSTTGNGWEVAGKYGYPAIIGGITGSGSASFGAPGYFLTQPIMVGFGGSGAGGGATGGSTVAPTGGNGGIGCGGGGAGITNALGANGGRGGDGAVFIWSW